MRLSAELVQALRNHRPDILDLHQLLLVGAQYPLQTAKMASKILRRRFPHITNTQRIDKACQGRLFAVFNGRQQVACRLFSHPLQIDQCRHGEFVEIGRRPYDTSIDQLLNQLVAQPLDIQRPA